MTKSTRKLLLWIGGDNAERELLKKHPQNRLKAGLFTHEFYLPHHNGKFRFVIMDRCLQHNLILYILDRTFEKKDIQLFEPNQLKEIGMALVVTSTLALI